MFSNFRYSLILPGARSHHTGLCRARQVEPAGGLLGHLFQQVNPPWSLPVPSLAANRVLWLNPRFWLFCGFRGVPFVRIIVTCVIVLRRDGPVTEKLNIL